MASRLAAIAAWILRWSLRALWALAVQVVIVIFIAVLWLSLSTSAPAWLWQQLGAQLPGLTLTDISGRFATGLRIGRLHWADAEQDISAEQVSLRWQAGDLLQGRVSIDAASAREVVVRAIVDKPPEALTLPVIDLPMAWAVRELDIGRLRWQPFKGDAVVLESLHLVGEGAGTRVTVTDLRAGHALGKLALQGSLRTQGLWPMDLNLLLKPAALDWPEQRVSVQGDISALRLHARGPQRWPLELKVQADVRPVEPSFKGVLRWPDWQPPGQKDWRLENGGLAFQGTAASGVAELSLRARSLLAVRHPSLKYPAILQGPARWQSNAGGHRLDVDWRGSFGNMPWLVKAMLHTVYPQTSQIDMQLADARLGVRGWGNAHGMDRFAGLRWDIDIPQLQRFQSAFSGSAAMQGSWRGSLATGSGKLALQADQLQQGKTALAEKLSVLVAGSLQQQSWQIDGRRGGLAASLGLLGRFDLAKTRWSGQLRQGRIDAAKGSWQLQAPAVLSLTPASQNLAEQCWLQSPWRVCAQADLLAERWTARLRAEAGNDGSLLATLRRDPRQASPALDADLTLRAVNLARLPVALPNGLDLQGRANASARLTGTLAAPLLNGSFALAGAALAVPAYGIDWRPLALSGRLLGDRMDWRGQITDSEGGNAELTGTARMRPVLALQARLAGRNLRLIYPPWASAKVSPDLSLALQDGRAVLRGDIRVPAAMITLRQLEAAGTRTSADVRIIRDRNGRTPMLPDKTTSGLPLDLAVTVGLGDQVKLSGLGLTSGLLGQLQLMQRPGEALTATGELRLADDALYEAYGQRLQIRTGRFLFAGPLTRPDIRLEAVREVSGTTVGVRLSGRARAPQAELFSDEAMSQEEILSLLVLGRPLNDTSAPTSAERQALALGAALKLGGRSGLVERLGERIGVSDFAVGTEGDSDKTLVAVSGYIRPDLYLSFGMGVFEPTQSLKMRYQLNKRLSLEAVTSIESAITLFYSWRY